jgi:hypothetical protein
MVAVLGCFMKIVQWIALKGKLKMAKMKNGILRSKLVTSIGIRPLNEIVKGVVDNWVNQKVKIWRTHFEYEGEWKNNKPHGKGALSVSVCECNPTSIPIADTHFKKLIVNGKKDCGDSNSDGANVINLFFAVAGKRDQTS